MTYYNVVAGSQDRTGQLQPEGGHFTLTHLSVFNRTKATQVLISAETMQRWQYFFFHFLFQGDNIKRGWKKNMSGKKHGRGENVNLAGSLVKYQT